MASQTVKTLLGQPVIALDTGRRVGSIQEILYDTRANAVTAIVLSKPPFTGSAKAVSAENIALFGVDVTLVTSERAVISMSLESSPSAPARAGTDVIRTQVITNKGKRLGDIADISINEKGEILGYRLSHSVIRDAFKGKPFIPVITVTAVGEDAIIVDPEALEAQPEEILETHLEIPAAGSENYTEEDSLPEEEWGIEDDETEDATPLTSEPGQEPS